MSYFKFFNRINYNGKQSINLLNRGRININVLNKSSSFFPYEMYEGDRMDNIAQFNYKDSYKDWLIAFSNEVIDPYFDWYLTSEELEQHVAKKYGSTEAAQENIEYCNVTTLDGNTTDIDHYEAKVTPLTKQIEASNNQFTYTEVDSYTVENQNNLDKRFIRILSSEYADLAERDLEKLFKDGN